MEKMGGGRGSYDGDPRIVIMRNIGNMGQDEFGKLCSSAGLTRNQSREDMTGWDYLVEFPVPRVAGEPADSRHQHCSAVFK